jgi:hypothetical protein
LTLKSLNVGREYEGHLDELRLWKVPRTPSEIQNTMNRVLTPGEYKDLVMYYNFDHIINTEKKEASDFPIGYNGQENANQKFVAENLIGSGFDLLLGIREDYETTHHRKAPQFRPSPFAMVGGPLIPSILSDFHPVSDQNSQTQLFGKLLPSRTTLSNRMKAIIKLNAFSPTLNTINQIQFVSTIDGWGMSVLHNSTSNMLGGSQISISQTPTSKVNITSVGEILVENVGLGGFNQRKYTYQVNINLI